MILQLLTENLELQVVQLAVGPVVNPRAVSLNRSTRSNIRAVAEAQGKAIGDVTVVILDRCGTPCHH